MSARRDRKPDEDTIIGSDLYLLATSVITGRETAHCFRVWDRHRHRCLAAKTKMFEEEKDNPQTVGVITAEEYRARRRII